MKFTIFEELVHGVACDCSIDLLFEPYKMQALQYLQKMNFEKFSLNQYDALAEGLFGNEVNFMDYEQAKVYFEDQYSVRYLYSGDKQ